jgi:hypothetical protein
MAHLPEYEREVIRTLRLVRIAVTLLLGAVAIMAILGVLGIVFGLAFGGNDGSDGRGTDVHARLTAGSAVTNTTEDGRKIEARILELTWAQGPQVLVRIEGGEPVSTELTRWYLYLDDNTRLAMTGSTRGDGTYFFALDGTIPAGKSVQFVHFNPDDSHGDIYFDAR